MQFLFPGFLLAGLAIAIPILIHLFYFRRFKPIYFTNVRFLREIKEETASRSRLRNLLVLLARILAILAMVAAFAQPFLPRGETADQGPKAVGIYIDNSFSMGALSRDVPLLEVAKMKANEIMDGYGGEDQFQIMTNTYAGQEQRMVSRDQARELIADIQLSPKLTDLGTVLRRQQQTLRSQSDHTRFSYLISDFQKNSSLTGDFQDTSMTITAIPLQAVQEQNVSIDSAWFEGPVLIARQANPLVVQVTNHGDEEVEQVRLSLLENGQEKPIGQLTIAPGATVTDTLLYSAQVAGWQPLELRITDFPVQFDDSYFLAVEVKERIGILVIYEGAVTPHLQKGTAGIQAFEPLFQSASQVDYSQFARYQLIILDDLSALSSGLIAELESFMRSGGNVLVFPKGNQTNLNGFADLCARAGARRYGAWDPKAQNVSEINTRSFVFSDVYTNARANLRLPATLGNYQMESSGPVNEEVLISYRSGQRMLARYPLELGNLFLSSAPLGEEFNDLVKTGEVFIPMVYKMALSGRTNHRVAYTIGKDREVELTVPVRKTAESLLRLRSDNEEFVPSQRYIGSRVKLGMEVGLSHSGIYDVVDDQTSVLANVAFNYDRRESDLSILGMEDILAKGFQIPDETARADLSVWVGEQERGIVLWRWCVILALAFLAIESLLLRFWKT
ncbi:MAG: BatA and WFA domain-containing protein [Saprospiraceae bacterium]|nr:BatA and WFA domain-containing protein [Saprospiraceae bacterium]